MKYTNIEPRDRRYTIDELAEQLKDYILQFVDNDNQEIVDTITDNSRNFVLHCKLNLRQR